MVPKGLLSRTDGAEGLLRGAEGLGFRVWCRRVCSAEPSGTHSELMAPKRAGTAELMLPKRFAPESRRAMLR